MHQHIYNYIEQHHIEYVLNIDETPIVWDMALNRRGDVEVLISALDSNKKRITVILGIIYSTKFATKEFFKCKPMIIFKGKTNAVLRDVRQGPEQLLRFNTKAWCTEHEFQEFLQEAIPQDLPPSKTLLMFDNFSAHCTELVQQTIQRLGYHCYMLPPNSTAFAQPLDVAINKTFKTYVRALYTNWMKDNFTLDHPSRVSKELLRQWVVQAFEQIVEDAIKRAFECVGIGVHYLDHSKIYWRQLRSLQTNIERTHLPSIQELFAQAFEEEAVSDNTHFIVYL